MLKQRYRLRTPGLFKRTLRNKRFFVSRLFVVYALKHNNRPQRAQPRFGIIVSKKTAKRAPHRNRVRRRIREVLRRDVLTDNALQVLLAEYRTFVLIVRPPAVFADFSVLRAELLRCFSVPMSHNEPVERETNA